MNSDLPTPTIWRAFTVVRLAAAALGRIPRSVVAVGVEIEGNQFRLVFIVNGAESARDLEDMQDILERFWDFNPDASAELTIKIGETPPVSPARDDFAWVYIARATH